MGNCRGVFAVLVFLFAVWNSSVSQAQAPKCATLFADGEKTSTLLEQATFLVNGLPTTAAAATSRLKLIDAFGAKDALALLGSDFKSWPLYLGTSPGGHVILVRGQSQGRDLTILAYKRLAITLAELREIQNVDFEIAHEKRSLRRWLERTENAFDQTVSDFSQATKLWTLRDSSFKRLETGILTSAGAFGEFDQPWLIRSTSVLTPSANGKSAVPSQAHEIAPLIEALLKMKEGI